MHTRSESFLLRRISVRIALILIGNLARTGERERSSIKADLTWLD